MRRFVLEHNIERYEEALAACDSTSERALITAFLTEARRELEELDAADRARSRPRSSEKTKT